MPPFIRRYIVFFCIAVFTISFFRRPAGWTAERPPFTQVIKEGAHGSSESDNGSLPPPKDLLDHPSQEHDELEEAKDVPSVKTSSIPLPAPSAGVSRNNGFWPQLALHYPVTSMIPLPTGEVADIPKIQHSFIEGETTETKETRLSRLQAVKEAFEHSWQGYKGYAWMKDEVTPVSGASRNTFGGWAATLVDSLDTLYIMGLRDDFEEAVQAVEHIDFTSSEADSLNVFETTIRYLGGLLGAYDLSNEAHPVLLKKATELGEFLYHAFDTPTHMPITRWNWKLAARGEPQEADTAVLLAEIGSLSLEFTRLSQLTGDPKFYDAVQRITNELESKQNETHAPGLWPVVVDARKLSFLHDTGFTLGAMADSTYEYLTKEYLLLGGLADKYRKMYEYAIETAKKHLFFRPMAEGNPDVLISGNGKGSKLVGEEPRLLPEVQHLSCYVGGMVGMSAMIFERPADLIIAQKITEGCVWSYGIFESGIMAENFFIIPCKTPQNCSWNEQKWKDAVLAWHRKGTDPDPNDPNAEPIPFLADSRVLEKQLPTGVVSVTDSRYILRPEAIESLFYMYRITGDVSYQDQAWTMFQAIVKHTRTDIAFSAVSDVKPSKELPKSDSMESFWTAETLKYFYLIFSSPELVSLDSFVFNTEAHPLKRPQAHALPLIG